MKGDYKIYQASVCCVAEKAAERRALAMAPVFPSYACRGGSCISLRTRGTNQGTLCSSIIPSMARRMHRRLRSIGKLQFVQNALHMTFHCAGRNVQALGDGDIGHAMW